MNCNKPGCSGVLKITHTYSQPLVKFQRAFCPVCRQPYCVTNFIRIEPVTGRGKGAARKHEDYLREEALRKVQERDARANGGPAAGVSRP